MFNSPQIAAQSAFLSEVLECLRRRGKALKHKNATPSVDRIIEAKDGRSVERIEIVCQPRKHQTLKLIVWEDRDVWVHACEAVKNSGWKFQYTKSGRVLGPNPAHQVIAALEQTLAQMFEMSSANVGLLGNTWDPLLANGPRPA